jgi:hypothetical protein
MINRILNEKKINEIRKEFEEYDNLKL